MADNRGALCLVAKDAEGGLSFQSIVLFDDETPEAAIERMLDEGNVAKGIGYFVMELEAAKKLIEVRRPDYVARDNVGDIWMDRLMFEVCKAFAVETAKEPSDLVTEKK